MYVFGCNTRLCTEVHGAKCWKAFVIQKAKASSVKVVAEAPKVGLWDTIMAPPVDTSSADKMATEMKALKVTDDEDQDGVYDEKYSVGFPPVKLHIVEEMIQEKASSSSSTKVETIPEPFRVQEGDADWSGEVYESTQLPGYDKYLEKFQKRVSSYPRQCVRFSPTSSPLMFCKESCPLAIGPCLVCGQRRHFELQLMPAILSLLPTCDDAHLSHIPENNRNSHPLFDDGMEWGTVMVYTCGTCQKSPGLIEAAVYVQVETV